MPAKERAGVRLDPDTLERVRRMAEERGITDGEALRWLIDEGLADEPEIEAEPPPWEWCAADFIRFCQGDRRKGVRWPGLTLPNGRRFRLEGFQRLIVKLAFAAGLVELLVLIPKGNGKTALLAALAVFHLVTTPNAQCFIAAAESEQADELYRFAQHYVDSGPLIGRFLYVRESTRRIRRHADQGFLRVLAADKTKQQGKKHSYNPTLAIIEELHAHENDANYTALRSAAFKNGALVLGISTAGHDENSTLGEVRRRMLDGAEQGGKIRRRMMVGARGKVVAGKDGRLVIAESGSGRNVMLEWACEPGDDLSDLQLVKKANPAPYVTIDGLEDGLESLKPNQFARYRANVWAGEDEAVFQPTDWDPLNDGSTIPEGEPVYVVVDSANKADTAAVTALWTNDDGYVVPRTHVWALKPRDPRRIPPAAHEYVSGRKIGQERIRQHIRDLSERNPVEGVIYDPMRFDESAELLEDEGFTMIEFPQTNQRLVPSSQALYSAIMGTDDEEPVIRHDGDPVLRAHVLAMGEKTIGEEWRFSKARSKKVIDAGMTLVMGIKAARQPPPESVYERRGPVFA